jgi:L-threonylcarbamoyladenylate synthase
MANQKNLSNKIKTIVNAIKQGKVLILPTDTVYGLVAKAQNGQAVKKIFKIKGRKLQKTLPIFVKSIKMAKEFAFIDREQEKFLKKVWPGKITVILNAKPKAQKLFKFGIISSEKKIGLRIPKYKLINLLLKKLNPVVDFRHPDKVGIRRRSRSKIHYGVNFPLTGTSANISGRPPAATLKKILKQFKNKKYQPDLIIDAGNLPKSKPSKVLDLTVLPPKILRK